MIMRRIFVFILNGIGLIKFRNKNKKTMSVCVLDLREQRSNHNKPIEAYSIFQDACEVEVAVTISYHTYHYPYNHFINHEIFIDFILDSYL